MDTLPVTLIVKAPNQQIEDQQIKCELSWTINKLKQHLSEVYPSKPPKHEQKLIYSGQLLNDSVMLKDVLRQYEGQDTHTVHLVCTPKANMSRKQTVPTSTASTSTQNIPEEMPGLRNRIAAEQRIPNMQMYNFENPEQFAMHMAMMQRAYWQYMAHYMNLAANQNYPSVPPQEAQQQTVPAPREQQPEVQEPVQPVAPAAPQPQPENDQNRDWLDIFYLLCRVMVFISIIYFYSSPLRCICVLTFAIGFYLYQMGLLINNNINNNNILQGEAQEEQAPSRLMVAWNFFTTFFASLLPEVQNVV